MRKLFWSLPLAGMLACQPVTLLPGLIDPDDARSAGELTVEDSTSAAYSLPAPNLSLESVRRHLAGDIAFEAQFVTAPAPVNPGLGPLFNNISCVGCHKGDGGGRAPEEGGASNSFFLRLSLPGSAANGGPLPAPGFGLQLQDQAIFGARPEARVRTRYTTVTGHFADGTVYTLRRPDHEIYDAYTPLPDGLLRSPRLSPPVYGTGLLELVPESAILRLADAFDRDGDGISGRPNYGWDREAQALKLGRFGWKAATPTLKQQIAEAYQQDMGITNSWFPDESSLGQPQQALNRSAGIDLPEAVLLDAVHYVRTLGVPARRRIEDGTVRRGVELFRGAQCASCHVPTWRTGSSPDAPELANQLIHPYTDLLVHDMGEDLADGRPDFGADGREWRTPPLWGIGLRETVQGFTHLLHDGRARSVQEAILWHGGEAEAAKEAFRRMSKADRDALLAFVNSL